MANIKHAVVGTDMLVGSSNAAYLKSVVFYKDGSPAAIDNGNIVVIGDAIGPETYKAEAPAADLPAFKARIGFFLEILVANFLKLAGFWIDSM